MMNHPRVLSFFVITDIYTCMRLCEINPEISRKMIVARLWISEGRLEEREMSFQKYDNMGPPAFNPSSNDAGLKSGAFLSEVFLH